MADDGLAGLENTRAEAPAREGLRVLCARPVRGARTPRVAVDVLLPGGIVAVFTLARLRGGRMSLRPPKTADGAEGLHLPEPMAEGLQGAALAVVEADPVANAHLKRLAW